MIILVNSHALGAAGRTAQGVPACARCGGTGSHESSWDQQEVQCSRSSRQCRRRWRRRWPSYGCRRRAAAVPRRAADAGHVRPCRQRRPYRPVRQVTRGSGNTGAFFIVRYDDVVTMCKAFRLAASFKAAFEARARDAAVDAFSARFGVGDKRSFSAAAWPARSKRGPRTAVTASV